MYKKLVRDNIPDIIRKNSEEPIIEILDNDRYKEELEKKLKRGGFSNKIYLKGVK